jgi:hypothetical protein
LIYQDTCAIIINITLQPDEMTRLKTGSLIEIHRRKFASQAAEPLLIEMHKIADEEGRQFQVILEEAMALYIETKRNQQVRPYVMAAFRESLHTNKKLGELLAK